jgi:CRP-like cAMP-binding protein
LRQKEQRLQNQPVKTPDGNLRDLLAATWLTHELDATARNALAAIGRIVAVAAGSVLMREGETNDVMAIVLDGRVSLRMRPERARYRSSRLSQAMSSAGPRWSRPTARLRPRSS